MGKLHWKSTIFIRSFLSRHIEIFSPISSNEEEWIKFLFGFSYFEPLIVELEISQLIFKIVTAFKPWTNKKFHNWL